MIDLFDAEELELLQLEDQLERIENEYYIEDDLMILREAYDDRFL